MLVLHHDAICGQIREKPEKRFFKHPSGRTKEKVWKKERMNYERKNWDIGSKLVLNAQGEIE